MTVRIKTNCGQYVSATSKDALYVPSFPQSIFSVQAATTKGVIFNPDNAQLIYQDGTVFDIQKHGKLYYLDVCGVCDDAVICDSVNNACDLSSWHEILGHCNYNDVLKLQSVVDGMKVTGSTVKPGDWKNDTG